MRRAAFLLAAVATVAAASTAQGQSRWSIEARGGAASATQRLAGAELGTGGGFELTGRYRFMPHLAAYAGWSYFHFGVDRMLGAPKLDVDETGYSMGLRFEHPLSGRSAYWVRAGGLLNHLEFEDDDGDLLADTGHGLGWETGAGLTMPLSNRLSLTPGVRYRSLSRNLTMGGERTRTDLRYVAGEIGFAFTF